MSSHDSDTNLDGLFEDSDEVFRVLQEDGSFDKLRNLIKEEFQKFLSSEAQQAVINSEEVKDALYVPSQASYKDKLSVLISNICNNQERATLEKASEQCWQLLYDDTRDIGQQLQARVEYAVEKILLDRLAQQQPAKVPEEVPGGLHEPEADALF